jgi:hypothetical protein
MMGMPWHPCDDPPTVRAAAGRGGPCGPALLVLLLVGGALWAACANPVPPSGGPRDETPPSVVGTRPVRDTVNVPTDTRAVYVEFSEYVDRTTLTQALTITPRFEGRLRFDWDGRGVTIELPTSLRDSTTYIFSFGTSLQDTRGVSLESPVRVAFATGPRINRGALQGRVVDPREAEPQARVDVFAYGRAAVGALPPDSLPERPDYRTQTGTDGTFSFGYLREQAYYVVALRDNNRNRRPDPGEPVAVPPRPVLAADSASPPIPVPWLLTTVDTTGPRLQRTESRSRQRVRLGFDEPVELGSRRPADWALRDSAADARVPVQAVYRAPGRPDAVVLRTAPMEPTRHVLPLSSALGADTLGQPLVPDTARFRAVDRPDTVRARFGAFVPEGLSPDTNGVYPLLPDTQPGVRFTVPPDSSGLRAAVALRDTAGTARPFDLVTTDGRTYRVEPESPLRPGALVDLVVDRGRLAGPDTTIRRRFRRVPTRRLGGLEGRVVRADTTHPAVPRGRTAAGAAGEPDGDGAGAVLVELRPTESAVPMEPRRQTVPPGSTFVFSDLPEGAFRFRAVLDRNGNGRWDGGTVVPFAPAEPITWSGGTTDSRPRWTNVLSAPLRIPVLRAPAAAPDSLDADTTEQQP